MKLKYGSRNKICINGFTKTIYRSMDVFHRYHDQPVSVLNLDPTLKWLASRLDPEDHVCVGSLPRDWIGLGETLGIIKTHYDVGCFRKSKSPTIKLLKHWIKVSSFASTSCGSDQFFGTTASIGKFREALINIGRVDIVSNEEFQMFIGKFNTHN